MEGFKVQRGRTTKRWGNQHERGRYEWNPKPPRKDKEILMGNKYGELEEKNDFNNE